MVEQAPTYIGQVKHVLGSTVTVELDGSLAGVAPIYKGHLQPVGQIGSLVRIPQGLVDLVGSVALLGISELSGAQEPSQSVQNGDRWLQVQLLGEVDRSTGRFQRGVGSYPGLDDPVHFTTTEDLLAVYPDPDERHVRLGHLSASDDVSVCLNLDALVLRHSAVVGATGSGKTSAVASMLQSLVAGGWQAANIVVVDPHGEYARALGKSASVRKVLESDDGALNVPFWALPADEILRVFVGTTGPTTTRRFAELVTESRRAFLAESKWLHLDQAEITSDTPVPFDLHDVWYRLEYENSATRDVKNDEKTVRVDDKGDPASLKPPRFAPYGPGGTPTSSRTRLRRLREYPETTPPCPTRSATDISPPDTPIPRRSRSSNQSCAGVARRHRAYLCSGLQRSAFSCRRCGNRNCNDALVRVGPKVRLRRSRDWSSTAHTACS